MNFENQIGFFELIENKINSRLTISNKVAHVLGISPSGAYKKINGSSKLSFEEAIVLSRSFEISIDQLISNNSASGLNVPYPFYSNALALKINSYQDYWTNMLSHMRNLCSQTIIDTIYLTNELPFFYYLQFPRLLFFKMYVWNRTTWKTSSGIDYYDYEECQKRYAAILTATNEILKIYNSYESKEIWNLDILRMTIMQLSCCTRSRMFKNPEDIKHILLDIKKIIKLCEDTCESGNKTIYGQEEEGAPVQIYLNELAVNSEIIFIKSNRKSMVYNKFDTPNYIRTSNLGIIDFAENWLNDIVKQSTLISEVGHKDRNHLIKHLTQQITSFEERIHGMIKAFY